MPKYEITNGIYSFYADKIGIFKRLFLFFTGYKILKTKE